MRRVASALVLGAVLALAITRPPLHRWGHVLSDVMWDRFVRDRDRLPEGWRRPPPRPDVRVRPTNI
jgi:hypothetical protein